MKTEGISSGSVYNHSSCEMEEGQLILCPKCKGHGREFGDDEECFLCGGFGEVIRSKTGWTRDVKDDPMTSRLW